MGTNGNCVVVRGEKIITLKQYYRYKNEFLLSKPDPYTLLMTIFRDNDLAIER
jgi:hypothetical protein